MQEAVGVVMEGSIMDEKNSEIVDNNKIDEVMLPGFRFHPTDEELVGFYLKRKIQQRPLSIELIKQLDIYKYDPWDLPKFASTGEKEWYFYCPRDRKYRNSARPNRVTGAGFWKATGTDRPIYSSEGNKCIGLKKSLVFYKGRAAKGVKTDWMMHEFRLPSLGDSSLSKRCVDIKLPANDSWAICRIFKKTSPITPRTLTHSWISSPPPNPSPSTQTLAPNTNLNSENIIKPTCSSPMQLNSNNIYDFEKSLLSPNNFTFVDHIPTFNSMSPTSNNYNSNNTSANDKLFENIAPLLDLPPNYLLPPLEDPSETSKSNNIDVSSMLLNMSSSVLQDMEFGMLADNIDGQCNEYSSSTLSQDQYHPQKQVNIVDHNHRYMNGFNEQDFAGTLLDNLNNVIFPEDDHQQFWDEIQNLESMPISGFLPFSIPETWKSSASLLWDCAPPLS